MPILHLHRREILILQRARVSVEDGKVVYAQAMGDNEGDGLVRRFNIPTLNASFLVLGQGCSLTQGASRMLCDGGVMVAFSGTGGTPFLLASQDYRPGRRLQRWTYMWHNPRWRLWAAKAIHSARVEAVRRTWGGGGGILPGANVLEACDTFSARLQESGDIPQLMGFEGNFSKALYREACRAAGVEWNRREPGVGLDRVNRNLDHANYLAYGIAGVALWAYGIPFSMPVTHGAARSGGLVFDLADAFKDAVLLPVCVLHAKRSDEQAFRNACIDALHGASALDGRNGTIGFAFRVLDALVPKPEQLEGMGFDPNAFGLLEKTLLLESAGEGEAEAVANAIGGREPVR